MTRRSKLPIPTKPASPQLTPTTTYAPRFLSSKRSPPSPPQSPSILSNNLSPTSPTRSLKSVRWECPPHDDSESRPSLERMESTDSMRENERFSPVPWVMSPPGSPPPLSLYTSVALLHYHIHHGPSTVPSESIMSSSQQVISHPTELPLSEPVSSSPPRSQSTSASNSLGRSVERKSRIMAAEKALEEFLKVEKAFKESPYVMPAELQPPTTDSEHVKSEISEDTKAETGSINQESHEIPVTETERDTVVELLEEYSNDDEADLQSPQPSPFTEHTKSRLTSVDNTPSPSRAASLRHRRSTSLPPMSRTRTPLTTDEPIEQPTQSEDTGPTLAVNGTAITRMPSIQRRGQEYLSEFLAKRKSQNPLPPPKPSIQPTPPPKTRPSPLLFLLCFFVFLSFLGNIILVTKVYQLQYPQNWESRLDTLMSPGKVGETFEIFTTPSSEWWTWKRSKVKETEIEEIPASPPRVHKIQNLKWAVATIWERRPIVEIAEESKVESNMDRGLKDFIRRTRGYINGIWRRVFGV